MTATFDSQPLLAPFCRCYWQLNNNKAPHPFLYHFSSGLSFFQTALSLYMKLHISVFSIPRLRLKPHTQKTFVSILSRTMATARQQPAWKKPATTDAELPSLKIYNSLTKTKVPFVPIDPKGKKISWYACGPTGQSKEPYPADVHAPAHS